MEELHGVPFFKDYDNQEHTQKRVVLMDHGTRFDTGWSIHRGTTMKFIFGGYV
jgi:hypothetical protein